MKRFVKTSINNGLDNFNVNVDLASLLTVVSGESLLDIRSIKGTVYEGKCRDFAELESGDVVTTSGGYEYEIDQLMASNVQVVYPSRNALVIAIKL